MLCVGITAIVRWCKCTFNFRVVKYYIVRVLLPPCQPRLAARVINNSSSMCDRRPAYSAQSDWKLSAEEVAEYVMSFPAQRMIRLSAVWCR